MGRLRAVVESTSADIVLSSTWRLSASGRRDANAAFRRYKIADAVGRTPHITGGSCLRWLLCCGSGRDETGQDEISQMCDDRVEEIQMWLRRHPETKRWCAIDDLHLSAGKHGALRGRCVRTNAATGMTDADARAIIDLIRGSSTPINPAAAAAEAALALATAPSSPASTPLGTPPTSPWPTVGAASSRQRRASTSDVAPKKGARREGSRRRARAKVTEAKGAGDGSRRQSPIALSIKFHGSTRAAKSQPSSPHGSRFPSPKVSPRAGGEKSHNRWQR